MVLVLVLFGALIEVLVTRRLVQVKLVAGAINDRGSGGHAVWGASAGAVLVGLVTARASFARLTEGCWRVCSLGCSVHFCKVDGRVLWVCCFALRAVLLEVLVRSHRPGLKLAGVYAGVFYKSTTCGPSRNGSPKNAPRRGVRLAKPESQASWELTYARTKIMADRRRHGWALLASAFFVSL